MKNIDNNAQTPTMSSKRESNARLATEIRELHKEIADSKIFSKSEKDALRSYLASLRNPGSVAAFAQSIRGTGLKNPAASAKTYAEHIDKQAQAESVAVQASVEKDHHKKVDSQPQSKEGPQAAGANTEEAKQAFFQTLGTCQTHGLAGIKIAQSTGTPPYQQPTPPAPRQYH